MTSDRPRNLSFDRFSTLHDATLREFDHFIEQDSISIRSETNEVVIAGSSTTGNSWSADPVTHTQRTD